MATPPKRDPEFWNIWWVLTYVTAALTIIVMFLEYLGVFRDLGLFLSGAGIMLTFIFGFTASTRGSVRSSSSMGRVERRLDGIDGKLDALDRIEALLRERLPRQP